MRLSKALQGIRDARPNLSKYKLAKQLGVEPIMIDRYVKGVTKKCRIEVACKIYKLYGVVVDPYNEQEVSECVDTI